MVYNEELNPAIHFNLLLFKGKIKRISVSIGAMASVFKRISCYMKRFGVSQTQISNKNPERMACWKLLQGSHKRISCVAKSAKELINK